MKHVDLSSVDSIKEKLTTLSQALDVFRKIRLGKLANMNPCLTHFDVLSKNHVGKKPQPGHTRNAWLCCQPDTETPQGPPHYSYPAP